MRIGLGFLLSMLIGLNLGHAAEVEESILRAGENTLIVILQDQGVTCKAALAIVVNGAQTGQMTCAKVGPTISSTDGLVTELTISRGRVGKLFRKVVGSDLCYVLEVSRWMSAQDSTFFSCVSAER